MFLIFIWLFLLFSLALLSGIFFKRHIRMLNITQNPVNNNNSDFFNAKLPLPPNEDTCENRSQDKSLGGRMNKFLKE